MTIIEKLKSAFKPQARSNISRRINKELLKLQAKEQRQARCKACRYLKENQHVQI